MTPHRTAYGKRDAEADTEVGLIRRTAAGWRVHSAAEEFPDLLNAMVLADLLVSEDSCVEPLSTSPPRASAEASELELLRVTVAQLEHALHTRVLIEQAIGVLAERHRVAPRAAFERLRHAARSRGRKVTDLARDIIASAQNPLTALPEELARKGAAIQIDSPRRSSPS